MVKGKSLVQIRDIAMEIASFPNVTKEDETFATAIIAEIDRRLTVDAPVVQSGFLSSMAQAFGLTERPSSVRPAVEKHSVKPSVQTPVDTVVVKVHGFCYNPATKSNLPAVDETVNVPVGDSFGDTVDACLALVPAGYSIRLEIRAK